MAQSVKHLLWNLSSNLHMQTKTARRSWTGLLYRTQGSVPSIHMVFTAVCNSRFRGFLTFFWPKAYTWYIYIHAVKTLRHLKQNINLKNNLSKVAYIWSWRVETGGFLEFAGQSSWTGELQGQQGIVEKKRKEKVESDGVQHRTTTSGLYTLIHICGNTHIHAGRNTH